jgi:MOSC domain-containing protein YiiM
MTARESRVIAVSVGVARTVPWGSRQVRTGIYKQPTERRVAVGRLGLEGDEQADREAHGGPLKAVYAYPSEHYAFWREQLPGTDLPWGSFGENLTTAGLSEEGVHVGDRFRIGSAVLEATKPRFPCYKLGIRFGREDIIDRFLASGRSGFYLKVLEEGALAAGDPVEVLGGGTGRPTIAQLVDERRRRETA